MKKEYFRLAFKFLVFLVLVVVVDWGVGKVYRELEIRAAKRNPVEMTTEHTLWDVNTDVVIIGASEVQHAYIPYIFSDSLGMSVYNCGEDGQFFYYQNAMVNGILDRYTPKTILWSVNPTFLSFLPSAKERISILKPFCKENTYCMEMMRLKSKYEKIKLISNSYVYNSVALDYILYSLVTTCNNDQHGYTPLYGNKIMDEPKNENYKGVADDDCVRIFKNTLERARNANLNIWFVFTPSFTTGNYLESSSYQLLRQITNQYGYPLIEEYFHDKELMKKELFVDYMHLNHTGAQIYSSILAHRMKEEITN